MKLAAFTIDVEPDYGGQIGVTYKTLMEEKGLSPLQEFLEQENVPATLFIVGELLDVNKTLAQRAVSIGKEFQPHSYSHPTPGHDVLVEAKKAREAYKRFFGRSPTGYRSPYGFMRGDVIPQLVDLGYVYDSSIFPTLRPGRFYNIDKPLFPYKPNNGIWELPFGCLSVIRMVVSIGYIKFFGPTVFEILLRKFGVPGILVIDSHLHDFVTTDLLDRLPLHQRLRYLRHRDDGVRLLRWLVLRLKKSGFRFVTLSDIVDRLERGEIPADCFKVVRV